MLASARNWRLTVLPPFDKGQNISVLNSLGRKKKKNILIKNNKNKKKAECREGTLITESTDEGRERTFYKLCSHQREMVEILLTIIPLFN